MKLRTEMIETNTGRRFPAIRSNETCPMAMTHDASAAHAFMKAIDDMDAIFNTPSDPTGWLEKRADEIMREWGFAE